MPIRGMEDKREQDKGRLKDLAYIDDLTLLYNRRYLYQYLPVELKEMKQLGKSLGLLMMDVDSFKEINDAYGHLCGDSVLVEIAEILRNTFRTGDTIVRYAGDEFIAILPGVEEHAAVEIAKRIIDKIDKNPFREKGTQSNIHVTISIGLALFPRDARDPESLIHQADRALYSSKRSGRNRTSTTKDISTQILDERKLEEIFPAPHLIGRQAQLERLKKLLDEAQKKQVRFTLVKGERGLGKTRLISEFRAYAQNKGVTGISASCSPEISSQPYQILITALESLFSSTDYAVSEFIGSQPEPQIAQLANYIHSLKQYLPEDLQAESTAAGTEQAETDLFKAICQGLIYVVKRGALFLVIDDFQWIDNQTLTLFNYIIKNLPDIPLLIIGAYREEEFKRRPDNAEIKELLNQIKQDQSVDELGLEPLEKKEILEMTSAIFGGFQAPAQFVDMIYDVSAGNPLFIEEVLRSLVSKGFIFYQDRKWQIKQISEASLPPFLKEAVQKRMAELDEETRPIVQACAVIGQAFDFNLLCKLLKQDPGYMLEVIDRAVKQHIILPESPFQTDKFKFISGAIREIIYNSLEPAKRQQLHRNLALIKENINKNNIAPVAGSLGYHFSLAHDRKKADLYAQMLLDKARWLPSFEEGFNFLQEALLKETEEEVAPLSAASKKLVAKMLRALKLAIHNIRLYPAHSTVRVTFLNEACDYLNDILDKDEAVVLSTAEGRLLINGEEMSEKVAREAGVDTFIELIVNQRIKSLSFHKGFTKEQLVVFLEEMGKSYDDLIPFGGISGMLRKKGISRIKIDAIHYEQTTKLAKKRTKFEEAMLIDYLLGKTPQFGADKSEVASWFAQAPDRLAEALERISKQAVPRKGEDKTQAQANLIANSLQKLNTQILSQTKEGQKHYQKNIAQVIKALDDKLKLKVLQALNPIDTTSSKGIIKDLVGEFSDEEILEMTAREFSESKGNLKQIRKLLSKFFLNHQRKQSLLPKLKIELYQLGLNEDETSWVLEENLWQGLPLREKVKRFLRLTPDDYIKLEISKLVGKFVSELLQKGQYNETGEIVDKLLKQLEDASSDLRSATVSDLDKISQTLIFKQKYFLLEQIISALMARLDKEKDPQVYSGVTLLLANICVRLIKKQSFIQATGILKEFNLRLGATSSLLEIQKQTIKKLKQSIVGATELINWLTKLFEQKVEAHQDLWELSKVIYEIGPETIGPLFDLTAAKDTYADPFKAYALRWNVAKVFKTMGDEAVFYLRDILEDKKTEEVKLALELLGHMQSKNAVRYLQPLLKYQDLNLRKEAITTLGKIGGNEAIKLLSKCVRDKNAQIRLSAIWALGSIGSKEVFLILKPLLADETVSGVVKKIIRRIGKR